ncbi:MAG: 4-alpha-glucanotransferase, partial [Clostridia bacterium]|nr:4-alpha-glucanotransferase [Clostridia bacterium]
MRTSGILLHISSLPSKYGIGTFGEEAYRFVDFLSKAGQTYWQILPIGITSYGDSPYQSFSSFAGNPYFIDPDLLCSEGYIEKAYLAGLDFGDDPEKVDFGKMYANRYKMLSAAYERFKEAPPADYAEFCEQNKAWLEGFALFMAIKNESVGASWQKWEQGLKKREKAALAAAKERLAGKIDFYRFTQYLFFRQWFALKAYANKKGIKIIGDLPIYVSLDSADVWENPGDFELDGELAPVRIAGCPPDDFSADGQRWGNPLYNWKKMQREGFPWWCRRAEFSAKIFDVIRIDHFRGFEAYWAIPAADKTAKGGAWVKGPGYALFAALGRKLGELPIIAEDLGFLTEGVKKLLKRTGYPGMKVLEFAFDPKGDNEYLPHNIGKNSVAYIGTHDNEPAMLWLEKSPKATVEFAKSYMHLTAEEGYNWGFIRTLMACPAETAIIQMQDILGLGKGARMNTPAVTSGN